MTRALERDRTRWLVLAGALVGLAFLAKMMQAFLVVPGFGLAYLWAGPARLRRRLWQLAAGLGAIIAGAGWWVVIAQLWPAGSGRTSAARRATASCSSRLATTGWGG